MQLAHEDALNKQRDELSSRFKEQLTTVEQTHSTALAILDVKHQHELEENDKTNQTKIHAMTLVFLSISTI